MSGEVMGSGVTRQSEHRSDGTGSGVTR
ncbi:hypothetical protein BN12_2600009 [Nostocoides japonicum T1-X7]|uniref:Uncharacterized protein n=1 Tax=Nostocoides japonicum T1-X7 TaxID=1194083 RepID=A0A077LW72_9MICO|nr:hypothetical protein BN12_2600009 [Tetrasphaera japonica T1-X7]